MEMKVERPTPAHLRAARALPCCGGCGGMAMRVCLRVSRARPAWLAGSGLKLGLVLRRKGLPQAHARRGRGAQAPAPRMPRPGASVGARRCARGHKCGQVGRGGCLWAGGGGRGQPRRDQARIPAFASGGEDARSGASDSTAGTQPARRRPGPGAPKVNKCVHAGPSRRTLRRQRWFAPSQDRPVRPRALGQRPAPRWPGPNIRTCLRRRGRRGADLSMPWALGSRCGGLAACHVCCRAKAAALAPRPAKTRRLRGPAGLLSCLVGAGWRLWGDGGAAGIS
jgi:hypothetical protein